jgi:vacuolar-type H+-ATPase subunit H
VAPDNLNPLPSDAVETAISRVLNAEVAARASVADARSEAMKIAERARETARRLALHTDRRIHRVRGAFAETTAATIAALDAEGAALGVTTQLTAAEVAAVEAAVAALARALTGGAA